MTNDKLMKLSDIEKFQQLLNQDPSKVEVKINSQANGAKYMPVNVIERLLDENYSGLWQTDNFRWAVVANEIIGSIDLKVFHPSANTWITRTGCASTMILTQKDKPAVVENKIKNTLVKDFPHLKAECLKNAAKSLGVRFGRNLNRDDNNSGFTYLSETVTGLSEGTEEALDLIETSTLPENERDVMRKKIERANLSTLKLIIEHLKNKQA
jgi:hypothetical protein